MPRKNRKILYWNTNGIARIKGDTYIIREWLRSNGWQFDPPSKEWTNSPHALKKLITETPAETCSLIPLECSNQIDPPISNIKTTPPPTNPEILWRLENLEKKIDKILAILSTPKSP